NRQECDGRHVFGAISHPALCLVPFHWRGMCYAHQFSREGSLCGREAEETAPDPWSAFTSSISTTLVAPVIRTSTPGDFISFCCDRPDSSQCQRETRAVRNGQCRFARA